MSSDDSQNYSARDYDDQYDDEVISESGGSSPGHSDDVEVVDARPVGGRPAKARPTAPLRSTSSKALPKKKVQKGEGSSSKPKGKSTSKPNTAGDDSQNYSARDYDDQYDDEVISESGGSSPGHSDDVEVVDARPVGGRPAKARPTAPLRSTSSKALPKKKVQKGEGSSSKPKGKSTSKPNTAGDDSQNYSARDYDDQYDDEVISESGGSSPGHSDDVEVVDARPVGGRPAKARPTAPLRSTSSKALPKKKVQKGEGSSSKPKGKSTSKPNTAGDQHTAGHPPLDSRQSGSFVAPDQTKSTGKRPMEMAEAHPPTDVHVADPKRARLTGEKPGLADALARGAFSLPEMFNMLFKMSPPPEDFVNEKTDYIAGQVAHHISQAHIESLNRYPGSDQIFRDAATLYPSRPTDLPALVKSFCSSEDAVAPLLQTLHQDPVSLQALRRVTAWGFHRGKYAMQESVHQALADGIEDWESVRELLPEQIPPPGPESFSDPPVGSTDPHTADSRSHVP
nr:uncharacterized protein LOC109149872 [Ipomoea trifida]